MNLEAFIHWPFDDPASVRGTEDEVLAEFRRVRDDIEATILKFVKGETGEAFKSAHNSIEDLTRKEDFGQRIKTIREAKGLSIKELADKIQVSEEYLSKTEQNQTEPSKYFIHSLGTACDLEYDALVEYLYYVKNDDVFKLMK